MKIGIIKGRHEIPQLQKNFRLNRELIKRGYEISKDYIDKAVERIKNENKDYFKNFESLEVEASNGIITNTSTYEVSERINKAYAWKSAGEQDSLDISGMIADYIEICEENQTETSMLELAKEIRRPVDFLMYFVYEYIRFMSRELELDAEIKSNKDIILTLEQLKKDIEKIK